MPAFVRYHGCFRRHLLTCSSTTRMRIC